MTEFPSDWPVGCPPNQAEDAGADIFRVVHEPRLPEDFMSYAELGKAPTPALCKHHSLSVFNSRGSACHQASKYPYLGDHVARAGLGGGAGKVSRPSATGHQEWWAPVGFDRASVFVEVIPCQS